MEFDVIMDGAGRRGVGLLMMIAVERQRDILLSSENDPQSNDREALLSSIRRPGVITQHSTPTSRKSITAASYLILRKASRGRKLYRIDRELGSWDVTARLFNDLVCGGS